MGMKTMRFETEPFEDGFRKMQRILFNGRLVATATSLKSARAFIAGVQQYAKNHPEMTTAQILVSDAVTKNYG